MSSLVHAAILAKGRGEKVAWVGGIDAYNLEVSSLKCEGDGVTCFVLIGRCMLSIDRCI